MARQATAPSRIASIILRSLTFVLLLIALIVLATNSFVLKSDDGDGSSDDVTKVRFNDFYAYRYMLSIIVIGAACSLFQLAFSIFTLVKGRDSIPLLDFFGDMFISYMLATGAAAGFGLTVDLKRLCDALELNMLSFDDKAFASASLLLLAFVTTAMSSILSAFALPKRV